MKIIYAVVVVLAFCTAGFAQSDDITLCHTSSTDKFALFASNKDFNKKHPQPRVYTHVSEAGGKMITFKTADGTDAHGYVIEAKKKTNNWIFVFQEWWGLNDHIKHKAEDHPAYLDAFFDANKSISHISQRLIPDTKHGEKLTEKGVNYTIFYLFGNIIFAMIRHKSFLFLV